MKGKKILFISSEVGPYMPQTEISTLTFNLPKLVNENGGQTRIFIPKYGNINERRHQLHEVIRLSGINLIIDDMDMPLIIKVASIPKERMQVYFIDSEDYFKGRPGYAKDENDNFYEDNDERSIFYCKGVIETLKKLNWAPDLIHVHGWIASLLPLYMRNYYNDDPIFDSTKVIVSLYEDRLKGSLDKNFTKKIKFDDIEESNLSILSKSSYENLYKLSVIHSDGLILSPKIKNDFSDLLNGLDIPVLECSHDSEDYKEKYKNFYNSFLIDK
jgi:starch synthase